MGEFLSRYGITSDRFLWCAMAILGAIVLGGILFSPSSLPMPFGATDDDPSTITETMEGCVTRILSEETIGTKGGPQGPGNIQYVQQVEVEITSGSTQGKRIVTEHGGMIVTTESSRVKPGMRVIVEHTAGPVGDRYYISDFIRRPAILGLTLIFVAAAAIIGQWMGVRSLVGTAFSVLVIVRFILPRILAGQNPVAVCIVGAIVLMAPTLYLVYGWKSKTHAAALGLSICLVITWILAAVFVSWAHVTGFGKEESAFLVVALQSEVDLRGLVLGGIILGTLGVLDDVTIGQSSAILELHAANPSLSWTALFRHGMVIGRDHIASMVNTLMMAYIGASLPLFLLINLYQEPLGVLLNRELLVQEIIRTLVGSLGLMMAVPVTSLIASWMAKNIWGNRKTGNQRALPHG